MIITNAKYRKIYGTDINGSVSATIDGKTWSIPLDEGDRFYKEILQQVEAGELTIEPADE